MKQYKNYVFDPVSLAKLSKEEFEKKYLKAFGKDTNYIYEKFVKPHARTEQESKENKPVRVGRKSAKQSESSKGSDTTSND